MTKKAKHVKQWRKKCVENKNNTSGGSGERKHVNKRKEVSKSNHSMEVEEVDVKKQKSSASVDINDFAAWARSRSEKFEAENNIDGPPDCDKNDNKEYKDVKDAKNTCASSNKAFYREFMKVVENSDVILQVLDARDPLGTRSKEVENCVTSSADDKKLILVLNKADLVPQHNLQEWIKYLRKVYPTVAVKSSTQKNGSRRLALSNSSASKCTNSELRKTSASVGCKELISTLANYTRTTTVTDNADSIRKCIRVGVVGFPNIGKSSLINSLKREKVCETGNVPGVTRVMKEVKLDSKIKLIDCPGLVLAKSETFEDSLQNCIKLTDVKDPVSLASKILSRCSQDVIREQYTKVDFKRLNDPKLDVDNYTRSFLTSLALSQGKLMGGGRPDLDSAARVVLHDWNCGNIQYFTVPPPSSGNLAVDHGKPEDCKIVEHLSDELNMETWTPKTILPDE